MPAYTPPVSGTGITINGTAVAIPRPVVPGKLVPYRRRGGASFTFSVRGGAVPTTDPYSGKEVKVYINGTLYFTGTACAVGRPYRSGLGWVQQYECKGLHWRGARVVHTDGNNGSNQSTYNALLDSNLTDYLASRAGRTVGQILTDVLTMAGDAVALDAQGIGQYSGLPSSPALPSATTTDLSALTRILPGPLYFGGDRLTDAIEGFLATNAPNHLFHIEPDGTMRFLDTRAYSASTLTMGTDPILPTELSRDISECFTRVQVRGESIAEMFLFSLSQGTLSESPFAHDGLTVAAAKAAWTPADFFSPAVRSEGTCTCLSTTSVRVDPSDNSQTWASNYWDQTSSGKHGTVYLTYAAGSTITMMAQRRVTANTSLSGSGTSDLTLDLALPHTNYDKFILRGSHSGAESVWTEYALPSWAAAKVARMSTYPFPYKFGGGTGEVQTSTPLGTVCWSQTGSFPFNEATAGITVDPDAGTVRFGFPTYMTAGNKAPDDVRALVPIYTGTNTATYPADSGGSPVYSGDGYTTEGIQQTLTVTVRNWRDPANLSAMTDYAHEIHDSVKDPIIEGSVVYLGLYEAALTPGIAINVAGNGYSTPWSSAALPVQEVELEWLTGPGEAMNCRTTLHCSNRRARLTDAAFGAPDRTGVTFDFGGSIDLSGMTPNAPAVGLGEAGGAAAASMYGIANQAAGSLAGEGDRIARRFDELGPL